MDPADLGWGLKKTILWAFGCSKEHLGVTLTRKEMARADRNGVKRGLWLKLGFACCLSRLVDAKANFFPQIVTGQ